jgi:hypothetical protein
MFGKPFAVYSDNGSHFVQGKLPALLKANGIRHFPTPKSHPSSVGPIEKYVQLILYGLRRNTLLVDGGKTLWDRFLPAVINSLNDRILKVQIVCTRKRSQRPLQSATTIMSRRSHSSFEGGKMGDAEKGVVYTPEDTGSQIAEVHGYSPSQLFFWKDYSEVRLGYHTAARA